MLYTVFFPLEDNDRHIRNASQHNVCYAMDSVNFSTTHKVCAPAPCPTEMLVTEVKVTVMSVM